MEQVDGFSWNLILEYFSKLGRESSDFIKIRQEKPALYIKIYVHLEIISRSFLLRMRNVSDRSCRENQNTHFVFSNFFFENRVIYEIMWKNMLEPDSLQMTIWRMHISLKATDTHSEHAILIAFSLQQWLHERASMLRYTYIACSV